MGVGAPGAAAPDPPAHGHGHQAAVHARRPRDVLVAAPRLRGEFMGKAVRINALGLRGPEIARSPADAAPAACFGDSITFGYGVGDEETYPHASAEDWRPAA